MTALRRLYLSLAKEWGPPKRQAEQTLTSLSVTLDDVIAELLGQHLPSAQCLANPLGLLFTIIFLKQHDGTTWPCGGAKFSNSRRVPGSLSEAVTQAVQLASAFRMNAALEADAIPAASQQAMTHPEASSSSTDVNEPARAPSVKRVAMSMPSALTSKAPAAPTRPAAVMLSLLDVACVVGAVRMNLQPDSVKAICEFDHLFDFDVSWPRVQKRPEAASQRKDDVYLTEHSALTLYRTDPIFWLYSLFFFYAAVFLIRGTAARWASQSNSDISYPWILDDCYFPMIQKIIRLLRCCLVASPKDCLSCQACRPTNVAKQLLSIYWYQLGCPLPEEPQSDIDVICKEFDQRLQSHNVAGAMSLVDHKIRNLSSQYDDPQCQSKRRSGRHVSDACHEDGIASDFFSNYLIDGLRELRQTIPLHILRHYSKAVSRIPVPFLFASPQFSNAEALPEGRSFQIGLHVFVRSENGVISFVDRPALANFEEEIESVRAKLEELKAYGSSLQEQFRRSDQSLPPTD